MGSHFFVQQRGVGILFAVLLTSVSGCGSDNESAAASTSTTAGVPSTTHVSGVIEVSDSRPWATTNGEAVITRHRVDFRPDGSYRTIAEDQTSAAAWDAAGRALTQWSREAGGAVSALVGENAALGLPDVAIEPPIFRPLDHLADHVLAERSRSADAAATAQRFGRPALEKSVDLPVSKLGPSADHAVAVIDAETGLPLDVQLTSDGKPFYSVEFVDFVPSTGDVHTLEAYDVRGSIPPGANRATVDNGFSRVDSIATIDQLAGYDVFTPTALPQGFSLDRAVIEKGPGQPTGAEGMNPPGQNVVSLLYRDNWHRLVVTSRQPAAEPTAWADPFASEGKVVTTTPITVADGPLEGATGDVVVAAGAPQHAWARDRDIVVTATGPVHQAGLIDLLR